MSKVLLVMILTTGKTLKNQIVYLIMHLEKKRFRQRAVQKIWYTTRYEDDKLLNIVKVFDQSNQLNSILKQQMKITDLDKLVTAERAQPKNQFVGPDDEMLKQMRL